MSRGRALIVPILQKKKLRFRKTLCLMIHHGQWDTGFELWQNGLSAGIVSIDSCQLQAWGTGSNICQMLLSLSWKLVL